MSVVSSLSSRLIPALGVEKGESGGLKEWFDVGSFVPSIDLEGVVHFDVEHYDLLVKHINTDYERFALSMAQSLELALGSINNRIPQSSWRFLILYYSAFYSAHSILRGVGHFDVNLTKNDLSRVNEIIGIYGLKSAQLASGQYSIQLSFRDDTGRARLSFGVAGPGKGVHDIFWRNFCDKLSMLAAQAVGRGSADASEFLSSANQISNLVRTGNADSNSWLADVRNGINYRHEFDTWFPQNRGSLAFKAEDDLKFSNSANIRLDFSRKAQGIRAFSSVCNYLALIGFEIADYVAARSSKGGAFGQRWRRLRELSETF